MTFLRNIWYVCATVDEVTRTPIAREILQEKIAFFRTEAGEPKAIGNVCPHRFASLSGGKLIGDTIECPYHGLRFDGSGACVHNPHGDGSLPPRAKVKAYPIVERYGFMWIWMGEPERIDLELIPDFEIMVRKDWAYFNGYLEVPSNYQLIVDNLMDLTHIQFLHPFLSDPEWVEKYSAIVRQEGDVVHVENRVDDIGAFPVWKMQKPDAAERGDQWMDVRWNAPSHVFIDIRRRSPREEMFAPNGHFMTPIDERRTHYFYRIGRSEAVNDANLHEKLAAKVAHAFGLEDEPMIADQQRNLGDRDLLDAHPVILQTDAPAIRARRILAKLIRSEQTGVPLPREGNRGHCTK